LHYRALLKQLDDLEERKVRSMTFLATWLLVVGALVGTCPARAEPLIPPNPAELQYLEQLHRVFSISRDPLAFRSDAELLDRGRLVCRRNESGTLGQPATLEPPAINQLALIFLCPQ
jgi:hypothetical protein